MNIAIEPTYNFVSLLDTLGLVQGLTLGILLVLLNKRKHKSTFLLGLFLILFSLELLPFILEGLSIFTYYPKLFRLPLNFTWLLFPIFFVYSIQVSIFSKRESKYWVVIPGVIAFVIQLVLFFQSYRFKVDVVNSIWFDVFIIAGSLYSWAIAIWNLVLLYKHKIEVNNYFSMVESKELHWARYFLIFSLVGSVLIQIAYRTVSEDYYVKVAFSLFDLVIIYWVSYHGVVQRNVLSLLAKKKIYDLDKNKTLNDEKLSSTTNESLQKLMNVIDKYMIDSESFIHTELTIIDLAETIEVHPRRISAAINTINKQNFNTYVNTFRVKKAETLLATEGLNSHSIAGIGQEVGFHSKSAFYLAFKKVTGTTPVKYKEEIFT